MVSIVILTKNEAPNLPRCLSSLTWTDDVHVLDSGSTDETINIALAYGARISSNEFKSFGSQRNFALEHLDLKYEWILFLDADEVVTQQFLNAVKKAIQEVGEDIAGYYCCWKMILDDRWLKYCDNFPKWQFRLVRKGMATFTDFGHGQKEGEVRGKILYIKEPYLHFSFSKGWTEWIERHNRYSSQEAKARLYNRPPLRNIFTNNPSKRNTALKAWLSQFSIYPGLRFIQAYFLNLGFMEGVPGFIYCTTIACQEFHIQIKMRELRRQEHNQKIESRVYNSELQEL